MKRIFTRQDAVNFLNCEIDIRPARIIVGLEKYGFKNVEKVGRGDKVSFICEQSDDTNEQCYYIFKDICINEYGYGKQFDYNKVLDIIGFHINNKEYKTLSEISSELGDISDRTLSKHRSRLSKIAKANNKKQIVKDKDLCNKRTYARDINTKEVEDITTIYENVILDSYYKIINKIKEDNEISAKNELALFVKYSRQDYQLIRRDRKNIDNFLLLKDLLTKDDYKYIATYPVWWDVATTNPYMNPHLKRKIYEVNLKCHGFDYVFYKRLYEISQELKEDEELLVIINKAIKHKEDKNNDNK